MLTPGRLFGIIVIAMGLFGIIAGYIQHNVPLSLFGAGAVLIGALAFRYWDDYFGH